MSFRPEAESANLAVNSTSPAPSADMPDSKSSRFQFALILALLAMMAPFSIDTYLPAYHAIAREFGVSVPQIGASMTAYLLAYAFMMLWHGAISDALGRRPVILANLALYAFASLGCAFSGNLKSLILFRILQGFSAGAGIAVGRAIIRDRFAGPAAQRMMSNITLMFGIAPAIAPVIGGALAKYISWQAIFWFLVSISLLLLALCWKQLRETHPEANRIPLAFGYLLESYVKVLTDRRFLLLGLVVALNFAGLFCYIAAAPLFLINVLKLSETQFAWLFAPTIGGIMLGAFISGRTAEKLHPIKTIGHGFTLMLIAVVWDLIHSYAFHPSVPWSIIPLPIYGCGMAIVAPSATLLILDLFPELRGLLSSLQGALQMGIGAVVSLTVPSFVQDSEHRLSLCLGGFLLLSLACWLLIKPVIKHNALKHATGSPA